MEQMRAFNHVTATHLQVNTNDKSKAKKTTLQAENELGENYKVQELCDLISEPLKSVSSDSRVSAKHIFLLVKRVHEHSSKFERAINRGCRDGRVR
jgi:hypothetical protein